ncbi:MAG: HupE/UreJ family protein, partial [Bacteroidota bacterium]
MESTFISCLSESFPFLRIGLEHILDLGGYDHMLFVIALCVIYTYREWKQVAWMVTAFTVGHSLTLLMAVTGWISISSTLVETLIPVTILITALHNIWSTSRSGDKGSSKKEWQYFIAAGFGLIHGLGFSNYLKAMLLEGQCLSGPLALFNIGLELGQLVIVIAFLSMARLVLDVLKVPRTKWIQGISVLIAL